MKNRSPSITNKRIEKLDNRLANQIAAGEVVDRPASVLKELMENSIDAGAKRIEVEVERGGTRLIKVTDDGSGINKDDLTLALTRHATSKIKKVEDLSAIYSLGFRGEALASISSVSRLTLTSRTHNEEYAWQAISEGRDMVVDIQPASAVVGTRIEVRDLFFNTPARQKFLRTERTEFLQIEDIFKRMALANFDISFILKHNGKTVKRVPAVKLLNDEAQTQIQAETQKKYLFSVQEGSRLAYLCGKTFSDLAIRVQCEHDNVSIKAFVGGSHCHRSESDIQYVFINNRAVKDKTLTHAIRQAYQERLPQGRMPTYVIFLTIDASKIDVNVHPTKHEVRFENQRDVHDLLFRSISEALDLASDSMPDQKQEAEHISIKHHQTASFGTTGSSYQNYSKDRIYQHSESMTHNQISDNFKRYSQSNLAQPSDENSQDKNSAITTAPTGKIIRLGKGFCLIKSNASIWLIRELVWFSKCIDKSVEQVINTQSIPLLFPKTIAIDFFKLEELEISRSLSRLGFDFTPIDENKIQLNGIPIWSKTLDRDKISTFFSRYIEKLSNQIFDDVIPENILSEDFLIQEGMVNLDSINYFHSLNIIDFKDEVDKLDLWLKKIDAEFAENLFAQDASNLREKEIEQAGSNVSK